MGAGDPSSDPPACRVNMGHLPSPQPLFKVNFNMYFGSHGEAIVMGFCVLKSVVGFPVLMESLLVGTENPIVKTEMLLVLLFNRHLK